MVDLIHTLVIERATAGAENDYGVPAQTWATSSTVKGLVQQRSSLELAQLSQAGPVASKHRAWMPLGVDLRDGDRIVQGGRTFQVTGTDPDVAGAGHHATADLHLVENA